MTTPPAAAPGTRSVRCIYLRNDLDALDLQCNEAVAVEAAFWLRAHRVVRCFDLLPLNCGLPPQSHADVDLSVAAALAAGTAASEV